MNALSQLETRFASLSTWEWALLGAVFVVGLVLVVLIRKTFPRLFRRAFKTMDPEAGDEPGRFERALTRICIWLGKALALLLVFLAAGPILHIESSGIYDSIRHASGEVLEWMLPRLLRLGILFAITAAVLRAFQGIVPKLVRRHLSRRATRRHREEVESKKRIETLTALANTGVRWFVIAVAGVVAMSELGFDIGPILAGAGVLGLAIGFGAQNMVRDGLAGVFVLVEDQYRIGDVVDVAGVSGLVVDFNLRRTLIRDLDGTLHTVPNGEIKTASNCTKEFSRFHFDLYVAYKEDLDRCIEVVNRIGQEMYEERAVEGALREPVSVLRVNEFGDSGIALKIMTPTEPGMQWSVRGEFLLRVKRAFDAAGIEIPFPHRTLYWGDGQAPVLGAASQNAG